MSVKTQPKRAGGFLASESNGTRSREQIVVKDGETLQAGQLFSLDADEKAIAYADGATVAGIAFDNVTADGADATVAAIVRDAEVVEGELVIFDGATTENIVAAITGLKALAILAR